TAALTSAGDQLRSSVAVPAAASPSVAGAGLAAPVSSIQTAMLVALARQIHTRDCAGHTHSEVGE
ncbi:MAG TPA: hypothetical protein PLA50_14620, partial [Bacteroidia bacterium]|nr:hypothetical protein [Bacteroidia bacterium]